VGDCRDVPSRFTRTFHTTPTSGRLRRGAVARSTQTLDGTTPVVIVQSFTAREETKRGMTM